MIWFSRHTSPEGDHTRYLLKGDNQHLVPRRHLHPGGFIPQRHSTLGSSHLTCTHHRYHSWGMPRLHSPSKTHPTIRRKILPDRLNPHHTPKTHAKISLVVTTKSTPSALTTHKQFSTKHHITDIIHSRSNSK
jgi:hypothetical protein